MVFKIPLFQIILLLAFLLPAQARSQESTVLTGRILTENGTPMEAVTVLIFRLPDSLLVKTSVTDRAGRFDFDIPAPGTYLVVSSILGEKTYCTKAVIQPGDRSVTLKDILLKTRVKDLKEVVIAEKNPFIERRPGRTVLNISSSNIVIGSNALEILNRAPGIQIDKNENLVMKGKTGVLILIDGKPLHLAAADAAALLRNTPHDAIDRIDLVTNPGARYEAGGAGGIIDIRMKKGKSLGTNGSLNGGAGYGDFGKLTSGISLNHRTRQLNLFGNYNYNNNKRPENLTLSRLVSHPETTTSYDVSNRDDKTRTAQSYLIGADHFIDPHHTIGLLFSGQQTHLLSDEENSTRISNNALLDSNILMSSDEERTVTSASYNLNYKGIFGGRHELTVDLDYFTYDRASMEHLQNQFLKANMDPYRAPLRYQNSSPSDIGITSARAGYVINLTGNSTLDAGFKTALVNSRNNRIFNNYNGTGWMKDVAKSDEFNFSERITAAYLTYKNNLSERTELEAGLRAEDTRTRSNSLTTPHNVNRRYLDFFPAFSLGHELNGHHKLNLSFSRRINRPLYEDLNPFLYFLDQYNFREGNPYLRPEYTSTAEIGHVYREKFSTTASYTHVKDIFLAFQKQDDLTGVTVQSKKNLNSQETVALEFAADLSPRKWWNTSFTVQGSYMHFTYFSDGNTLDKHSPFYTADLINSFSFKKELNAELIFKYESATNYGLFDFEPYYGLDLSLSRTLLKKRASIRFSVTDILNTRCNRYSTLYQNLNVQGEEKAESRVARITFNYRFGKASVKGARKRSTAAEEESRRIKG